MPPEVVDRLDHGFRAQCDVARSDGVLDLLGLGNTAVDAIKVFGAFEKKFFAIAQIILVATGVGLGDILVSILLFLGLFAAEALNTAVEEVIDRISPEMSIVGKHAKDLGSFAVFCMLLACGLHLAFTVFAHLYLV